MDRQLLDILLCPVCGGDLALAEGATLTTVPYAAGARDEVERGAVGCAGCGRQYPVAEFVLSLAEVFPPVLRQEAAFWERYYLWLLEQGSEGFHDLRRGLAPYLTLGVPDPFPAADTIDRYDIHYQIADDPLVRQGQTVLDMGVGLGWTSLTFARAGYAVTAFEPSAGPVRAAKRYAMGQGVFIEYLCAALGHLAFGPASFDTVTAFHSLHHVPDLESALRAVQTWLRPGGALALDEHIGNSRLARALGGEVVAWAEAAVLPRYRTLPPEALATLPQEPHSALEDSSVDRVLPLVRRLFSVRLERPRHVVLDHYPLLYYLDQNRDLAAYRHALTIANQMQEWLRRIDPDGADYVTLVAENAPPANAEGGVGNADSPVQVEAAPPPVAEPASGVVDAPPEAAPPAPDPAELTAAYERIGELEAHLTAQEQWARGLEWELQRKDAELARLQTLVRRLENGRVMRLLRRFRR